MKFLKYIDVTSDDTVEVDVAYFDGYPIGDRLLEGVMFECRIVDDKVVAVVHSEHVNYMNKLDSSWLEKVNEAVNDPYYSDSFYGDPTGDSDVYLQR